MKEDNRVVAAAVSLRHLFVFQAQDEGHDIVNFLMAKLVIRHHVMTRAKEHIDRQRRCRRHIRNLHEVRRVGERN